jgi:antitoxin component of MazEF toxin-antitoxin module
MKINLIEIGNSKVVTIHKPMLAQVGLDDQLVADVTIENGSIILRKPSKSIRTGWREAEKVVSLVDGDVLVLGEFANTENKGLVL